MAQSFYPPSIAALIDDRPLMPLDAGIPVASIRETLDAAMLERLFGKEIIRNRTAARLSLAGLWLLYDHLDECHSIAQSVETPDGSYWHAIMHRREGDFSNSKYWYRRVGAHATFPLLHHETTLRSEEYAALGLPSDGWDPFVFVDRCEEVVRGTSQHVTSCREIQQIEWRLLFEHCFRKAIAT